MAGSSIVNYTGNAGLGIGSNPDIPVTSPNDNLKVISDTSRDIMLLDSERNMRLFNQKVKDRDALTELILKNQVSTKDIGSEYLPKFLDIKKDVEKSYNEWGGNPNDIKGYKKYQDAVTNLQDYSAHAQTNTKSIQQLKIDRSKETLPWKQKALDKWINDQQAKTKKDPWELVDPYQNLFSFSMDPILKLYKTGSGVSYSPDGLFKYEDTYGDFGATLKSAQNEYLNNGESSEDMRQWLSQVEAYNPLQKRQLIQSINGQLEKYNKERGLQPEQSGYADSIDLVTGPDGQYHIKSDPATFAAKYSLANQEKYTSRTTVFQKDYGAYQVKLVDESIKKAKLGVDWYNAETRRGALNLKQRQADKMSEDEKQFSQTYDKIGDAILLPQPSSTGNVLISGDADSGAFVVNLKDIPQGATYMQGLGPNGQPLQLLPKGVDFSKKSKDPGIVRDKSGNVLGYKGNEGHYDANYFVPAGTIINGKKVAKDIKLTPREMYKLYKNSGYEGSFKDFVQEKFKGGQVDYQLEGANGKADRVSSYVSQRALSNKATKKGQPTPYAADELDLIMSPANETGEQETPEQ